MVNNVDFNKLEENQKVNYVKNLLFNSDLTKALDVLLQYEKKDLKIIKIILSVLDEVNKSYSNRFCRSISYNQTNIILRSDLAYPVKIY